MGNDKDIIQRITFDVTFAGGEYEQGVNDYLSKLLREDIVQIIQEEFKKYPTTKFNRQFRNVVFDLSVIRNFSDKATILGQLRFELSKWLEAEIKDETAILREMSNDEKSDLTAIQFYLLKGVFPWWYPVSSDVSFDDIIRRKMNENREEIISLFEEMSIDPAVIKRINAQLTIDTLGKIIYELDKQKSVFHDLIDESFLLLVKLFKTRLKPIRFQDIQCYVLIFLVNNRFKRINEAELLEFVIAQISANAGVPDTEIIKEFTDQQHVSQKLKEVIKVIQKKSSRESEKDKSEQTALYHEIFSGATMSSEISLEKQFDYFLTFLSLPAGLTELYGSAGELMNVIMNNKSAFISSFTRVITNREQLLHLTRIFPQDLVQLIAKILFPKEILRINELIRDLNLLSDQLFRSQIDISKLISNPNFLLVRYLTRQTLTDDDIIKSVFADYYTDKSFSVKQIRKILKSSASLHIIEKYLTEHVIKSSSVTKETKKQGFDNLTFNDLTKDFNSNLLKYFLWYGTFPWWAKELIDYYKINLYKGKDRYEFEIVSLLLDILGKQDPSGLSTLLSEFFENESLIENISISYPTEIKIRMLAVLSNKLAGISAALSGMIKLLAQYYELPVSQEVLFGQLWIYLIKKHKIIADKEISDVIPILLTLLFHLSGINHEEIILLFEKKEEDLSQISADNKLTKALLLYPVYLKEKLFPEITESLQAEFDNVIPAIQLLNDLFNYLAYGRLSEQLQKVNAAIIFDGLLTYIGYYKSDFLNSDLFGILKDVMARKRFVSLLPDNIVWVTINLLLSKGFDDFSELLKVMLSSVSKRIELKDREEIGRLEKEILLELAFSIPATKLSENHYLLLIQIASDKLHINEDILKSILLNQSFQSGRMDIIQKMKKLLLEKHFTPFFQEFAGKELKIDVSSITTRAMVSWKTEEILPDFTQLKNIISDEIAERIDEVEKEILLILKEIYKEKADSFEFRKFIKVVIYRAAVIQKNVYSDWQGLMALIIRHIAITFKTKLEHLLIEMARITATFTTEGKGIRLRLIGDYLLQEDLIKKNFSAILSGLEVLPVSKILIYPSKLAYPSEDVSSINTRSLISRQTEEILPDLSQLKNIISDEIAERMDEMEKEILLILKEIYKEKVDSFEFRKFIKVVIYRAAVTQKNVYSDWQGLMVLIIGHIAITFGTKMEHLLIEMARITASYTTEGKGIRLRLIGDYLMQEELVKKDFSAILSGSEMLPLSKQLKYPSKLAYPSEIEYPPELSFLSDQNNLSSITTLLIEELMMKTTQHVAWLILLPYYKQLTDIQEIIIQRYFRDISAQIYKTKKEIREWLDFAGFSMYTRKGYDFLFTEVLIETAKKSDISDPLFSIIDSLISILSAEASVTETDLLSSALHFVFMYDIEMNKGIYPELEHYLTHITDKTKIFKWQPTDSENVQQLHMLTKTEKDSLLTLFEKQKQQTDVSVMEFDSTFNVTSELDSRYDNILSHIQSYFLDPLLPIQPKDEMSPVSEFEEQLEEIKSYETANIFEILRYILVYDGFPWWSIYRDFTSFTQGLQKEKKEQLKLPDDISFLSDIYLRRKFHKLLPEEVKKNLLLLMFPTEYGKTVIELRKFIAGTSGLPHSFLMLADDVLIWYCLQSKPPAFSDIINALEIYAKKEFQTALKVELAGVLLESTATEADIAEIKRKAESRLMRELLELVLDRFSSFFVKNNIKKPLSADFLKLIENEFLISEEQMRLPDMTMLLITIGSSIIRAKASLFSHYTEYISELNIRLGKLSVKFPEIIDIDKIIQIISSIRVSSREKKTPSDFVNKFILILTEKLHLISREDANLLYKIILNSGLSVSETFVSVLLEYFKIKDAVTPEQILNYIIDHLGEIDKEDFADELEYFRQETDRILKLLPSEAGFYIELLLFAGAGGDKTMDVFIHKWLTKYAYELMSVKGNEELVIWSIVEEISVKSGDSTLAVLEKAREILSAKRSERYSRLSPVLKSLISKANKLEQLKSLYVKTGHEPVMSELPAISELISEREIIDLTGETNREDALFKLLKEKHEWMDNKDDLNKFYVNNAGLVLLWPFLTSFFTVLELYKENKFVNFEAQQKAVHLLQYMVNGNENQPEHLMALNKILCGLDVSYPIQQEVSLTDKEKEEANSLLRAIIKHWTILKSTSVDGLRETFLQRDGALYKKDQNWNVKVEQKGVDVLLKKIPWGINTIKLSYNKYIIFVEWNY
jgi:hypothetical protein